MFQLPDAIWDSWVQLAVTLGRLEIVEPRVRSYNHVDVWELQSYVQKFLRPFAKAEYKKKELIASIVDEIATTAAKFKYVDYVEEYFDELEEETSSDYLLAQSHQLSQVLELALQRDRCLCPSSFRVDSS